MEYKNEDKKNSKSRCNFLGGFSLGVVTTVIVLILSGWFILLEAPFPWKVTDPSDTRFSSMNFKYTDYSSQKDLQESLREMFPVGTDKAQIDKVLVETAKGSIERYNHKHPSMVDKITYRYGYDNIFRKIPIYIFKYAIPTPPKDWPSHYVSIDYDQNDKLLKLNVLSAFGLPINFSEKSKKRSSLDKAVKGLDDE